MKKVNIIPAEIIIYLFTPPCCSIDISFDMSDSFFKSLYKCAILLND